jgi:hypothetical protein
VAGCPVSGSGPDGGHHLGEDGTELGLGVLTGRERARAVGHLQQCGRCRARVHRTAFTSDELLRLVPGQQPPAGFPAQVTERLRQAGKPPAQPRRPRALAAGAGPAAPAGPAGLRTAALVTPAHQRIGNVYLHSGPRTWMFTTVDLPPGATTVICQLTDRAGRVITVGSFRVTGGDGYWGSPEPDQPTAITSAQLITTDGTILATATFGTTR